MSEPTRPWWASSDPDVGEVADEDPLERFLAARNGDPGPGRSARDDGGADDGGPDGGDPEDRRDDGQDDGGHEDRGAEPWLEAVAASLSGLARELLGDGAGQGRSAPGGAGGERPAEPGVADAGEGSGPTGGAADPHRSGQTADPGDGDAAASEHGPDVCGICPVCVGLRALADARPELMGHLAEAAHHLALATRTLRDRPDAGPARGRPDPGSSRGPGRGPGQGTGHGTGHGEDEPLEHIDLD